jgi:hypothetical protein
MPAALHEAVCPVAKEGMQLKDEDKPGEDMLARRQVTVHDVARHAAVSSMTVSRVVNGRKVREELRVRVEAAIAELNYVPNVAARAARAGSFRIGVLFSKRGTTAASC